MRLMACALTLWLVVPWGAVATYGGADPAGAGSASQAAPPKFTTLFMKAGTFDPAAVFPPLPADLLAHGSLAGAIPSSDGRTRFILQFGDGVNPALIDALRARGIAYERYLPDGGLIASAEPRNLPSSAEDVGARALLPLHPAFKLDPSLWSTAADGRPAPLRAAVLLFENPSAPTSVAAHGSLFAFDGRLAILDTNAASLLALSREPDVEWIEPYAAPTPLNNYLARTMGARQSSDGPFLDDGASVWSYNNLSDTFPGLNGSGIVINIADTGIDISHPAFDGRVVAAFGYGFNATCDCAGYPHGTHVAGTAAGNGTWRPEDVNQTDGQYAGVAPAASLVAQLIFGVPRTTTQLSQDAFSAGAFVNSNSWGGGPGGAYTSSSQAHDELVLDANGREAGEPQMVYVFASGNSGPGVSSVESPGTAKNVITVGATGNTRSSSADQVVPFSSRGPTADGRIKPDVVAPGEDVWSALGDPTDNGCWGDGGCSYRGASGTSMSTPAVSGAAALVAQYYMQGAGRLPSAAMVKAILIGGATPLAGYSYPGFDQGWGRVNVARSIHENASFHHLWWDEGTGLSLQSGRQTANFSFFAEQDQELRIVLAWSDVPGTASSAKALINDLDLEVSGPDGQRYTGNGLSDGFSVTGVEKDAGNNTEVVRIHSPWRGVWNVSVRASTVPSGEQKFALVASGNITTRWVSLMPGAPQLEPAGPIEDDPVAVIVPIFNRGTIYSAFLNATATLEGPEGMVTVTAPILGVRPGDDFPAVFTFVPKRGLHTLHVVVDPERVSGDAITTDNTMDAQIFVRGFEVALTVLKNAAALPPSGSDTLLLQVENRGNVVDSIQVASATPPGWSLSLNVSSRALEAGETAFIAGTVTAPDRVLAGETGRFNFTARSAGNASRLASVEFEVDVAPSPSANIEQESFAARADPGSVATMQFSIENSGNVPLHFDITASFAGAPPPGWSATATVESLDLAPYSTQRPSVTVAVAPTAVASETKVVVVRVASPDQGSTADLLFRVTVNRTGSLRVEADATSLSGRPGETLEFPVRVQNDGNARETFEVSVTQAGGGTSGVTFNVDNATVVVEPFADAFVSVRAVLGRLAAAGDALGRAFLVSSSAATFQANLTAHVEAVHGVEVKAPTRIVLRQGSANVAVITLTNTGNLDAHLALLLDASPVGVVVEGWTGGLVLPRGESRTVQLHLSALSSAPAIPGEMTVSVRPADGVSFADQVLHVPVEVRASDPQQSFAPALPMGLAIAAVAAAAAVALRWRRD